MQGGWGTMGAGAWGSSPPPPQDDDVESPSAPPAPAAKQPAFGSSFRNNTLPQSTASPAGGSSGAKEAELSKREKELDAREARLKKREKELEATGQIAKKKNWPVCLPVWHHDISEVPEGSRRVVREAYACWWGLVIMLTYQVFCASVMLGYDVENKVPSWFLSIIFWISGVPLGIVLWYKRIYYAAKDDSTVGYLAFFFFFFVNWAWCVFCAVGVQINAAKWCWSGFIAGFDALDTGSFPGIIFMVGGAAWSVLALFTMWVMKDAWFFFRGQGGVKEVQQKEKQDAALAAFKQQQQAGGNSFNRI